MRDNHNHEHGQHIALVTRRGTQHPFVELWREEPRDHFTLIDHYPTLFQALDVVESSGAATWYLTSAAGRLYMRIETGHN